MTSSPPAQDWRVRVPASSANLGPGFDCLGVAVGLELRVICRPADRFTLELAGDGARELPRDESNLLARTLAIGAGAAAPPPVALHVDNEIPLARGLGSSSAATVAGLALGQLLAGATPETLDRERLLRHAVRLEGHADNVAPALHGDLVVSGVEDDAVVALPARWPDALRFVVVIPDRTIETAAARRALPATIAFGAAVANSGRLARLLAALHAGRFADLAATMRDALHEPYRLPLVPELAGVLERMRAHPRARGCYLSGSGPTIVGLCEEGADELGEEAIAAFTERGVPATYRVLEVDRRGLECTRASAHTVGEEPQ